VGVVVAGPSERVTFQRRESAVFVGLNYPGKRNALDNDLVAAILTAVTDASREPCVLVIHSSTPGMFVAGADLGELMDMGAEDSFEATHITLFDRIEAHRWPSIAIIDGPAYGGGCELALACDFRIGSPRARFAQPEPRFGLIAGAGGNWRLPELVGLAVARRMLYLGTELDAEQALSVALLDRLVATDELESVTEAMVREVAARSWRALELTKLALRSRSQRTTHLDIASQASLFEGPEKAQRVAAFLDRKSSR